MYRKIIFGTVGLLVIMVPMAAFAAGGELPFAGALEKIMDAIMNILFAAAGVMIVVGAFQFLNAGGDPGTVSKAKNSIIYAIVAIVIAAAAGQIADWAANLV